MLGGAVQPLVAGPPGELCAARRLREEVLMPTKWTFKSNEEFYQFVDLLRD